uniref:Uncharacterized protein n=1 Tax=Arundo donax TaxID=35708 RepID=A0A0A9BIS0_ARUDO
MNPRYPSGFLFLMATSRLPQDLGPSSMQ